MNKLFAASLSAVALLGLSACGGTDSSTAPADTPASSAVVESTAPSAAESSAPAASVEASPTEVASPTPTAVETSEAPASETASPAASDAPEPAGGASAPEPTGTMVLLSTLPAEKVGEWVGETQGLTGLGDGVNIQWVYENPEGLTMRIMTSRVPLEDMVENLQGTEEALGKIGYCGLLYGNEATPMCYLRLEGDVTLPVAGDSDTNLELTREFTKQWLTTATVK
ncbi:MAG TPA: hypothetical protein K8V15_05350 [Tessaracoccus flavescens]|uniref:Uncharacterized protein n=1 Tax=Tessaracoccus flavescens TaxID=399497 RepID=A0A921EQ02_9ACTN|nr:hypothetical protein [Tessaracoccus flavescens]